MRLVTSPPHAIEKLRELLPVDAQCVHLCPDDVFAEFLRHFDDYGPRHTWFGHDEMITLDARLDTSNEFANVSQLLLLDASQALAGEKRAAW